MSSNEQGHRSVDGKRAGSAHSHGSFAQRQQVRMRRETSGADSIEQEPTSRDEEKLLAEVNRMRTSEQLRETQLGLQCTRNRQEDTRGSNRHEDEQQSYFLERAEQESVNLGMATASMAAFSRSSPNIISQARYQPNLRGNAIEAVDAQSRQIDMLERFIQQEQQLLFHQMQRGRTQRQRDAISLDLQHLELSLRHDGFRDQTRSSQLMDSGPTNVLPPGIRELEESKRRVEALKARIHIEQQRSFRLDEAKLLLRHQRLRGDFGDKSQGLFGLRPHRVPVLSRSPGGIGGNYSLVRELAVGRQSAKSFASEEQREVRGNHRLDQKPVAGPRRSSPPTATRNPTPMAMDEDEANLSKSQQLVRSALEFFQASKEDVILNAQCQRSPIRLGQVGLRCKFCSGEFQHRRGRGSVYYPARIAKVYQAAQNINMTHLLDTCTQIPEGLREDIKKNRTTRGKGKASTRGRAYWVESCTMIGLVDYGEENGIWFTNTGDARSS